MFKSEVIFLQILILLSMLISTSINADEEEEIIAFVEEYPITNFDINQVIYSSPLAGSYPLMDEKDQAGLRGEILMKLINLNLLYQESLSLGLDKNAAYLKELESYKKGYIYRQFMNNLRAGIQVPQPAMNKMVEKLKGNSFALEAAISQYKARQYRLARSISLAKIGDQLHLRLFTDRIKKGMSEETILASADKNYTLKLSQLTVQKESDKNFDRAYIEESLFKKLELDLVNIFAEKKIDNLAAILKTYSHERLPALLIARKEKEWIPDTTTAEKYLANHPLLAYQKEQRYISQIVLDDLAVAESIFKQIKEGSSFYRMAQKYSVDPIGRKKAGQIGWVAEGTGLAEIEAVLKTLKDNEVSPIIKTAQGFHLVMIEGRKPAIQRPYSEIYDRVKQAIIQAKLPGYMKTLFRKYKILFARSVEQRLIYQQNIVLD